MIDTKHVLRTSHDTKKCGHSSQMVRFARSPPVLLVMKGGPFHRRQSTFRRPTLRLQFGPLLSDFPVVFFALKL
jgi:hypothetical protein